MEINEGLLQINEIMVDDKHFGKMEGVEFKDFEDAATVVEQPCNLACIFQFW